MEDMRDEKDSLENGEVEVETALKTLDLSNKGLKKIEKDFTAAYAVDPIELYTVILDNNELKKFENLEACINLQTLSASKNHVRRLSVVSQLKSLCSLDLSNNSVISIEGLKDLKTLKHLNLSGNYIKLIDRLQANTQLEYLDLSDNAIGHITDISFLLNLKELYLHKNHLSHLSHCEKYLPTNLELLSLHENSISDLAEISRLGNLVNLKELTFHGNPCVDFAVKQPAFNYRPYLKIWCLNLLSVDGVILDPLESLKAEWLYSQGRGRAFRPGEHSALAEYLASACPPNSEKCNSLPPEEERKLRLILSKAEQHQQQLREQIASGVPLSTTPRNSKNRYKKLVGVAERMVSSYHDSVGRESARASPEIMSRSFDSSVLRNSPPAHKRNSGSDQVNQNPLQTATTLVPVPESLISPDVSRPLHPLLIPDPSPLRSSNSSTMRLQSPQSVKRPQQSRNNVLDANHTSPKSGSGYRRQSAMRTPTSGNSPKFARHIENSPGTSPGRKTSLAKDTSEEEDADLQADRLQAIQMRANQKRLKSLKSKPEKVSKGTIPAGPKVVLDQSSDAWKAALCIQRRWRGYHTRNLNQDVIIKLKTIQANRIQDYIIKVSKDMEATKAALEGNRKLQVLQMQAINAMWKKMTGDEGLDGLSATCANLYRQMDELQNMVRALQMQNLKCISTTVNSSSFATQTEISAVHTPQGDADPPYKTLDRPQQLAMTLKETEGQSQSKDSTMKLGDGFTDSICLTPACQEGKDLQHLRLSNEDFKKNDDSA